MPTNKQLSNKQYATAMIDVGKLSFKIAPFAVTFKLIGIVVNASLPISVTYFASQTITKLTAAYGGNSHAGKLAVIYAIATVTLGLITSAWSSLDNYINQLMRYKIEAKIGDSMYDKFLSLEYWRYDDKITIELYDKAQKFAQFYAYISDRLSNLVTQLVSLLFAILALFTFLPVLALIVFVAVIPGVLLQFQLSRGQLKHWNNNVDSRRTRSYIEWNLFQPSAISELRLNRIFYGTS
jgi:ATP-binding cassette subfamily B protein